MDAVQDAGGVPEMAEIVRVGGQEFKKRNIEPILALLGVFFFSLWTLYVQEMLNPHLGCLSLLGIRSPAGWSACRSASSCARTFVLKHAPTG
jgi:hypothetical protein